MSEPDAASPRRPRVLLLAGDVRDAWARALADAGFEVATTGWLDGITAARLERPDVVLVSADLPPDAPRLVLTAFRSAASLAKVPIVVASAEPPPPEPLWGDPAFRADRSLPANVDPATLIRELREVVRTGRLKHRRRRAQQVALALAIVALLAIGVRAFLSGVLDLRDGPPLTGRADSLLRAIAVAALALALAVAVASRRRLPSPAELRTMLGWAGLFLPQSLLWLGVERPLGVFAGWSLALLAFAGWAALAPRVRPRTPAARRGWWLLAALLAAFAAGPWVAYAWMAYAR